MRDKRLAYAATRRGHAAAMRRKARLRLLAAVAAMVLVLAAGVLVLGKLQRKPSETPLVVEYVSLISQYAREYDLEPAYLAAVIMAESSYNPQAVSSADARGLMQLLPSTAEWIAGKLDEEFATENLFDPETNVRYGSWYLHFLMQRYDGDKRCASAAYHAGQGTVDSWLQDARYSQDGETLEVIGYASTDTYVNRVLKFYERYMPIYAEM